MSHPIKIGENWQLMVRAIGSYNYTYGKALPIVHEAEITAMLEARTSEEASYFAHVLDWACGRAIRERSHPVARAEGVSEPADGCTMVAFYEPGKGVDSARVTLTHTATGRTAIGYDRTINGAIRIANAEIAKVVKI